MRIPTFSIPSLAELGHELGAWVWAMPDDLSHRVCIEHSPGRWMAGVEKDGECVIAALWKEDTDGAIGALIDVTGRLARHLNQSLTDNEKTERIWSYFETQAMLMSYQRGN